MTCEDFEKSFDEYVDDMLEPQMAEAVGSHLAKCPACDREVTRWQQTRILLSTAVADFATAVDVSSVRRDVVAALGLAEDHGRDRHESAVRQAAHVRAADARRSGGRSTRRTAASGRHSGFAAVWRFASAATVSASIAAAAVLLLSPAPTTDSNVATGPQASVPRASYTPAAFRLGRSIFADVAPAAYTPPYSPPPLARPETSHVDGLEAAPGHLVSTWIQPRTNARVIWVEDRGLGAPVRTAGFER